MFDKLLFLLIVVLTIRESKGARILVVVPTPSISHQIIFRPLTLELAKRGHEVTVITTDPAFTDVNRPENLTEIDIHDVTYSLWKNKLKETDLKFGQKEGIFVFMKELSLLNGMFLEVQMKTEGVQNIINKDEKYYDLLVTEAFSRPALMFSHIFKAPLIQLSSFGMWLDSENIIGAPRHLFLYPNMINQRLYNLTFSEKVYELYKHYCILNMWYDTEQTELISLKKYFGGDVPPYEELYKNVDMLFLNIHPMLSNNQPLPPNVISIWGIHTKPVKSLPEDLERYLTSSKNGVIYLSFGTNALSSMLPPEKVQILINAFSKLPFNILWKWEQDELPGKPENVKIVKWFPQSDLLHHPNIKLFITQCGLQSLEEAINAGVPLIGIPMLGDQWYNAELFEYHKIGLKLDLDVLTEDTLTNAIFKMTNDYSFKDNIISLRTIMHDQIEGGLDRAVWWTEYVLRHGGAKHLRPAGANMTWLEYLEAEFVLKLIILTTLTCSSGAKILVVVPTPSISHQVVFRPLTQELASRGHEVTVITPNPVFTKDSRPANLTEIDVHDVTYGHWKGRNKENSAKFGNKDGLFEVVWDLTSGMGDILETQLKTKEVQDIIQNKNKTYYDLLMIEAFIRPTILFSHIFKAPVIQISSLGMPFGNEDIVGVPTHPFLYPTFMHQRLYNLTFWEKFYELYKHYWIQYTWYKSEDKEVNRLKKYFGNDVPCYRTLYDNVDMLFLNIHPLWTNNQPVPSNVISIWGIHKKEEKPLPEDLQKYLNSSKNGVIYLSFGSNVLSSMLPAEKIQILINTFSKLPFDIVWKWEEDELPGKSENIKVSKWLPQSDLLRHPKVKLFITQGGLQSTEEAINAGVPLIAIPMFGDQWYNLQKYEFYKIGMGLELENLSEDKLTNAIMTVINDQSFKKNIKRLSTLMSDHPQGALDRAVWWTEYVLRHGGAKHFRAAGANISWAEYYEVELHGPPNSAPPHNASNRTRRSGSPQHAQRRPRRSRESAPRCHTITLNCTLPADTCT
ncbi:unnamed protein product [Leptosia nina]|uniref:UDP-glycosyltransferase n=1 Tax=Leptosia nina TaxID=320188 RepID=A0AAV1JDW2_9NEOP